MTDTMTGQASIRHSVAEVLTRIRMTAEKKKGKTERPTADFSNALNSVGEHFVDLLLRKERRGQWWLDEEGKFHECVVRTNGDRSSRNFARGESPEWDWFPAEASRLADPETGPDHVVSVSVPLLDVSDTVCLEQKLRFGTRQDAFAGASTYLKHLLHGLGFPRPTKKEFIPDAYFNRLLEAVKSVLCKRKKDGTLAYAGSVPQVCLASMCLLPNKVVVTDRTGESRVECEYMGFLAPIINSTEFQRNTPEVAIVRRAKVKLWIGLDSLLQSCTDVEVEEAWTTAVAKLTWDIHNPSWRDDWGKRSVVRSA